jgi:hypothetical protein
MRYKILLLLALVACTQLIFAQSNTSITVPLGGNAYTNSKQENLITKNGIENWSDKNTSFKVYVRFAKTGTLSISLKEVSKVVGENVLGFIIHNQTKTLNVNDHASPSKSLEWEITDTGYVAIEIKGIKRTSDQFPVVKSLTLSGSAIDTQTSFVKSNEGNFFYWGRRGPSVHLNYPLPEKVEPEWFYNELTVPVGEDVIGSYFMANGFGQGYFGIQVNSDTERRVLFSVWSPFTTDDPKSIPESHQIKMLKKGEGVYTGEFGNEGSGGQSYLKYNWKAGNTYKFLLRGLPTGDSTTTYTAYFFAPELNQWQLIASFKRPKTHTYLARLHSFLENFIPQMGDKERKVLFNNQWICDTKGNWTELNTASFTTDNTGRVNYRKDYAGGILDGSFYLRNCGFFSDFTPAKTIFTREKTNQKPNIDLSRLP